MITVTAKAKPDALSYSLLIRIALLIGVVAILIAGCIREPDNEYGGKGEFLAIGAHFPKVLNDIVYTVGGQNYMIEPLGSGNVIAAVKARVVNPESSQVILSIDERASILRDVGGVEFSPFDAEQRKVATTQTAYERNLFGVHLWGQHNLTMGFEISGWFFFEVPESTEFASFVWEDVESVSVHYPGVLMGIENQ